MTEELYNKINKFCNETDWKKYPTYEHALEEFVKGIVTEATKELQKENKELKILISSLVYEINQIWNIDEMNDDLRKHAEKIDREVTLSKMADDNRIVLNALGFVLVPPEPKVDVKEV